MCLRQQQQITLIKTEQCRVPDASVILADNFDKTADVALQLAGIIAGSIIGRALLKMISTLGLAGSALLSFTRALSAARTMAGLATAFTGEAQDNIRQRAEEWQDTQKDAVRGTVDDLIAGKSAAEAFVDVLDQIAKLLDIASS